MIAKKIEHTERAYCIVELPLLESDYNHQQKEDEKLWRKSQNDAREAAERQHQEYVDAKQRLVKIGTEVDKYKEQLLRKRKVAYEKTLEVARKKIEEEKSQRLAGTFTPQLYGGTLTSLRLAHNAKLAEENRRREAEEARIREEEERQRRERLRRAEGGRGRRSDT